MSKAWIEISPDPVPGGVGLGMTSVSWDAGSKEPATVWVSEDGGEERLFAAGPTGQAIADWIQWPVSYRFVLRDAAGAALAESTVTRDPLEPDLDRRVLIATVSEAQPPYADDTVLLFRSLRRFGGRMAGCRAVAWFVGEIAPHTAAALADLEIEVRVTETLDPNRPYANKLRMFQQEPGVDWLVALDNDLVVARDFASQIFGDAFASTVVDDDRATDADWQAAMIGQSLPMPAARITPFMPVRGRTDTVPLFHGGIQIVPAPLIDDLRRHWLAEIEGWEANVAAPPPGGWSPVMRRNLERSDIPPLALAVHRGAIPWRLLPLAMNMPTHIPVHPLWDPDETEPMLIHHHHRRDEAGRLLPGHHPRLNAAIQRINDTLFPVERHDPATAG